MHATASASASASIPSTEKQQQQQRLSKEAVRAFLAGQSGSGCYILELRKYLMWHLLWPSWPALVGAGWRTNGERRAGGNTLSHLTVVAKGAARKALRF